VRAMQAESLAAVLPEGTLALGADLNTWRGANEPAPKYFRRLFASTAVTIDESGPGHRSLDYMFFRAPGTSARYRVVQDKYGSEPLACFGSSRAGRGHQLPEELRMVEPLQVHQLVNEHVLAHKIGHQHEAPIQADVSVRRAGSPAPSLIAYAHPRHAQAVDVG